MIVSNCPDVLRTSGKLDTIIEAGCLYHSIPTIQFRFIYTGNVIFIYLDSSILVCFRVSTHVFPTLPSLYQSYLVIH